jgi:hypothetical protein
VGGTCETHGGGERCLQGFGWGAEEKRPLVRPRRRWKVNMNIDLKEIRIGEVK